MQVKWFLKWGIVALMFYCSTGHAKQKAYVTNANGFVTVLDTSDDSILTTITLDETYNLYGAVAHPDGTKVYVVGNNGFGETGNVYIINTETDLETANSPIQVSNLTSSFPTNIAITPNGSELYIAAAQYYNFYVMDTSTNALNTQTNTPIPPNGTPSGIAIASISGSTTAYVGDGSGANDFFIIPTLTNTLMTINNQTTSNIQSVAITSDGTQAYFGSHNGQHTIYVVNTSNNTQETTISLSADPSQYMGIAMTPQGTPNANKAYVASSSNLIVIDTLTHSETSSISLGQTAVGVGITPDGLKAYVANGSDVTSINTSTDSIINTVTIGGTPRCIAVALLPSPPSPSPSPVKELINAQNNYTPLKIQKGL